MILPVIRELAGKYTKAELDAAAHTFETEQKNVFDVRGKDDGEILTNLLMASVVRERVEGGMSLPDAIREHTRSIQKILGKKPAVSSDDGSGSNSGGGGTRFF